MTDYKKLFPIFDKKIAGKELVYLDSAATSQIAKPVLDAIIDYEITKRANVHRGVHTLGDLSTQIYDESRKKVADFIHANIPSEIVFTKNATDSLNIIALAYVKHSLKKGDLILVSEAEHHSNYIEWQELAKEMGFEINFIPVNADGALDYKNVKTDWTKVKFISIHHVSNVLGYVNDVATIVKHFKKKALQAGQVQSPSFCVDASQSVAHLELNVQKMGIDFLVFSGHKMYGPMGIGVLWVNRKLHDKITPAFYGGGMVRVVSDKENKYAKMPEILEAGTPNVSGAVGIATACQFIKQIGYETICKHDQEILGYATAKLLKVGAVIYGTKDALKRGGLIAFNITEIPSHDLATIVNGYGVAIRSGQHCVMPWHAKNKLTTTARLSIGIYNHKSDIDILIKGIIEAKKLLSY